MAHSVPNSPRGMPLSDAASDAGMTARASVSSTSSAAPPPPRPTVVFGPALQWVPRTRDYASDQAYAAFRQRTLTALANLPDYPVDLGVSYRAR